MEKILIIDDDIELTSLFEDYLVKEYFFVDIAYDGSTGLEAALSSKYDLIILDMMLPDMVGTDLLVKLRQKSTVPVLMFTAKGDDLDRIIGLESGADDYVEKPCSPRELVARIRAILRRVKPQSATGNESRQTLHIGPLNLSSSSRKASWFKRDLNLTSVEFSLLEALAQQAGQVVSKNNLSEHALGRKLVRYDRSIDVHISSIRRKLDQHKDERSYIQTVRGKGYQLIKGE